MVDEDGNPVAPAPRDEQQQDEQSIRPQDSAPQQLDDLIDRVTGRDAPPPPRDPAAPTRALPRDGAPIGRQPLQRPLQDDRPIQ